MALELITFLGLVLLAEGVLLALFPAAIKRMMADLAFRDSQSLRMLGLSVGAAAGIFLLILAKLTADASGEPEGLGFPGIRAVIGALL